MQTQGASSLWGGSSGLSGLDSNWGMSTPSYSSGANNMNLLGYGGNSLSNNQGHMQSGASSTLVDSINSSRGGWGAPGTLPPSQSTKLPTSSSGNMQGSLPVSGAQHNGPQSSQPSGSLATTQSPGPNGGMSSQGNSAFGNAGFQKISTVSSGLAINPATSITNSSNGSSAQSSDNLGSAGWGMPNSTQDSRVMGTNSWGNPSSADWDQSSTTVSQSQGSNPQAGGPNDQQRPSSWAQAAGKGLNLQASNQNTTNSMSPEEVQRQTAFRMAIESHDGWGKKPIRQDTQWSIETSPKVPRKISTASVVPEQQQQKGTNNIWNNNNGTAIWEANKDNVPAWSGNANANPVARAPGQPPSNWPGGQQKPPDPSPGNQQWGVGPPGQAPGPDKNMGPWGAPPGPGNQSNNTQQWGGSTETGYFGGPTAGASSVAGNISTWGEAEGSSAGWGADNRNSGGNDGTSYWGDPQNKPPTQQPNWNAPGNAPPGQQAIGQNRKMGSGWGDPMGPPDPKMDDGTGLWQSGHQPPPRNPGQWTGDPNSQAQWNPAIGKPNPKLANQNPAQYGGVDDLNWNLPKEDIWSEESMGGWDDADMGTWNDTAQQTNSSWNSATGWNKEKRSNVAAKEGAMKFPGAGNHPPQMRSRLLQQLMDMGFSKDDAQHALISNNMNIQNAITDLYGRRGAMGGKKEGEFEMGRMSGLLPDDDISDTQQDNSYVPNMNHMQNTPFNNAQAKIPNQFPYNGPSLNNPSSLNTNNPSINNALQQKIIQKFQSQQPPPPTPQSMNSINQAQGPMGRSQLQQQMAQQQILQQLRMAVQAGLISPQLLNQQLPAPVLVMLQQLLQQQQNLQQLITTQQMLQQPNVKINPQMLKMQLDQVAGRINSIKQQILLLQRNISSAQNTLLGKTQSQQPQQPSPDSADNALPSELNMNNLSISSTQPQSRLNQWKRTTPDKESPDMATISSDPSSATVTTTASNSEEDGGPLNKTVGSKPQIQQSGSAPNLRRFDELGLTQLGGDTTWSTSASGGSSQNWPISSSDATMGSDSSSNADSLMSTAASSSSNSSNTVMDAIPAIPEFVPGKPWQGIAKNVEEDPHMTPGSIVRSLSVNTVKDDYLLSLTKSSPNSDSNSSWPTKPVSSMPQGGDKPWSSGGDSSLTPSSFTSDVWGLPMGKGAMSRPPPGLPQQGQQQKWQGMNRQHSWAGSAARSDGGQSQWGGGSNISTALILHNLTPEIDGSTLRTLCMQHGPLQYFYLNMANGQALVKYRTPEEAIRAQKSLNSCRIQNTTIAADFVTEQEAMRLEQMSAMPAGPSHWSQGGRHSGMGGNPRQDPNMGSWGTSTPVSSSLSGTGMWGNTGLNTGLHKGGNSGLWGTMDDNSTHNLLGNMLEPM